MPSTFGELQVPLGVVLKMMCKNSEVGKTKASCPSRSYTRSRPKPGNQQCLPTAVRSRGNGWSRIHPFAIIQPRIRKASFEVRFLQQVFQEGHVQVSSQVLPCP